MNNKITVEYCVNAQSLQDSYYALYGALDDDFVSEQDQSIAHNMRNFTITFDHEKMALHNLDKNETNTFLYQDLYQIKKTEQGYLFFVNKLFFYFVKFDLFPVADLATIDSTLQPYYQKYHETELATIENYELDEKRIYTGLIELYANAYKLLIILVVFVLVIFHFSPQSWYATISLALVYCLLFFILSRVFRRLNAKKLLTP